MRSENPLSRGSIGAIAETISGNGPTTASRHPAAGGGRRHRVVRGRRITRKDIVFFTRQLSTTLQAGIPLLQSLDLLARGHANPAITRLLGQIRADIESGASMAQAFRRHPRTFDALYCSLVDAGEQGGVLDVLLERLSLCMEKSLALRSQIRSAMIYPIAVLSVALAATGILMLFVIPAFKDIFASFGATLPAPTRMVIGLSDLFVEYWYFLASSPMLSLVLYRRAVRRSEKVQRMRDRWLLCIPVVGSLLRKATLARWSRTLATMFAAGTPLVEAMDPVADTAGNWVYHDATRDIAYSVRAGSSLTSAMHATRVFDSMMLQMTQVGEESGALDSMLMKVAECYEREVDESVAALSSLIEPVIIVVLGMLIGGMVLAMYLPVFGLGQVV